VAVIAQGDDVGESLRPPAGPSQRAVASGAPARPAGGQTSPRSSLPIGTTIWTLAALSGVATWLVLYAFVLSGFQEASSQHSLYATLRSQLAEETAPLGGNIRLGTSVAILKVPQAGVNDVVLEGTTAGVLEQGPGLLSDTPLPGQVGNCEIFGRQTMFGGPFRHLDLLRPGDLIEAVTGQGTFVYAVTDVRYSGEPLPAPMRPGESRLTLVTAAGSGWRGAGTPNQILYVDATLRGTPVGAPRGMPTAVTPSQLAMHGDTSVLMPLVLWMQLLLVIVVALVWVRSRWGGRQTWLVGAPLILAVLWAVSETAIQLLPNLL
jgi:sortase A